MTTTTVSPEQFRVETERRLIDSFELMSMLGLRSREAVWKRVKRGALPEPVIQKVNIALWDRDAIPTERS
jgi:predicted DNA-binding transcriptional regulator AlpA